MNTTRLLSAWALVALSFAPGGFVGVRPLPQLPWHTRPDRWAEPRRFQTPFDPRYERYLAVTHQPIPASGSPGKVFSPNKGYWFASPGPLPVGVTPERPILIFNERTYVSNGNRTGGSADSCPHPA